MATKKQLLKQILLLSFTIICSISYGQSKKDTDSAKKVKKEETTVNRTKSSRTISTTKTVKQQTTRTTNTSKANQSKNPLAPPCGQIGCVLVVVHSHSKSEVSGGQNNSRVKETTRTTSTSESRFKQNGRFSNTNKSDYQRTDKTNTSKEQKAKNEYNERSSRFGNYRNQTKTDQKVKNEDEGRSSRFGYGRNQTKTDQENKNKADERTSRFGYNRNQVTKGSSNTKSSVSSNTSAKKEYVYKYNSTNKLSSDLKQHFRGQKYSGNNFLRSSRTSYKSTKGKGVVRNKKGKPVDYSYFVLTDSKGDIGGFYLGSSQSNNTFNVGLTKGEANDKLDYCKHIGGEGAGDILYDQCVNRLVSQILADCLLSWNPADCAENCWYNGGNCIED